MTTASKITLLRVAMIPLYMVLMYLSGGVAGVWMYSALAVFIIASVTDFIDGEIARKCNQITDFGKFIDPLADKMMVIGALVVLLYKYTELRHVLVWAVLVVIFRELAISGVRMLAAGEKVVIAAKYIGKVKTVVQIVCICTVMIEPLLARISFLSILSYRPLTYLSIAAMVVMTVWSGVDYMYSYRAFLNPEK